jgi:hypothetical protein
MVGDRELMGSANQFDQRKIPFPMAIEDRKVHNRPPESEEYRDAGPMAGCAE